jgi:antiviral helicase SKI2
MCGRAGRRGIDQVGYIFILLGDKNYPPRPDDMIKMLEGAGDHVESKFRLSYKTIISFLSRNIKNIFEFFKESYLENQKLLIMPETMKKQMEVKDKLQTLPKISCHILDDPVEHLKDYLANYSELRKARMKLYSNDILYYKITPGRILLYNESELNKNILIMVIWNYKEFDDIRCILVENNKQHIEFYKKQMKEKDQNIGMHKDVLYKYFEIKLEDIIEIMDWNIKVDSKNDYIKDSEDYYYFNKKVLDKYINEVLDVSFKHNPKILDCQKVTKGELNVFQQVEERNKYQKRIEDNPIHVCYEKQVHLKQYREIKKLEDEYVELSKLLNEENLKYYNEFQKRIQILKQMDYVDDEQQIKLKGKAAREIASTCCILVSELLLSNILDKLDICETVAFLSGFVYSKNEIELFDPEISDAFSDAVLEFTQLYEKIKNVEKENLQEESKYNRRITFEVSYSVYLWMKGTPFKEILCECDLEEGKLYNLIMRLFLFLDEIRNFYEIIGSNISSKFADAKKLLMRDILSCRSLYLREDININI